MIRTSLSRILGPRDMPRRPISGGAAFLRKYRSPGADLSICPSLPRSLPAYLLDYLRTYLRTYLLTYQPTYLPTSDLPRTYLPPSNLPKTNLNPLSDLPKTH